MSEVESRTLRSCLVTVVTVSFPLLGHPYEAFVKTLKAGGAEGKYFDLSRLGGEKYSESGGNL